MVTKKNLVLGSILAGVAAAGIFASSSFASGPIVPVAAVAPVMPVTAPAVHQTASTRALSIYRQVRSFWLSRAIVR